MDIKAILISLLLTIVGVIIALVVYNQWIAPALSKTA